jgi:hypothetical protein
MRRQRFGYSFSPIRRRPDAIVRPRLRRDIGHHGGRDFATRGGCPLSAADASKRLRERRSVEVVMFRNHRIPSNLILAVLAIVGADIGSANAQGARSLKLAEERFSRELARLGPERKWLDSELSEFADWLRPKWRPLEQKLEEVKVEERANEQMKLRETASEADIKPEPNAAAPARPQQLAAIEQQAKIMHSWIDDAQAQIVADLQKRAGASEDEVAEIFERNIRAAAQKSTSPPIEIDPAKLTIKFAYSVDAGPVRIKPSEIDLGPIVKKAVKKAVSAYLAYLACLAGQEVHDALKSPASGSAASAGDSAKVENCVYSTRDLLKDAVRSALKGATDRETMARAAERGD